MNAIDNRLPGRLGLWTLLLLGIFAWAPTTYPGYWQALEGFVPVLNAANPGPLADIATDPDLWRGTGGAAFLIARPLIVFLGLAPVTAVRLTFALAFILASLGTYIWLYPRLGDRGAALAGLLYALFPPFLATVYVRGSLSDALILALLPVALAGFTIYAQTRFPGAAGVAVIAALWMWRTQAGLALLATLILLAYVLWVERDRLGGLVVLVTGLAGLLALLPLWSLRAPPPVPFQEHFLHLFQLLESGWQVAPSQPGWQDGYPFQLGFPAVAFALVLVWLLWQNGRNPDWSGPLPPGGDPALVRLLGFGGALVALCVLLSLGISEPIWRLTRGERLLTYPWQVLLFTAPFLAAMAGSLPRIRPRLRCTGYWSGLLLLVLLGSYTYLAPEFIPYQPPTRPAAILGARNDILVLETNLTERSQPPQAELEVVWQPLRPIDFDYNVFFQALQKDPQSDQLQVAAQLDIQPLPDRPATTWRVGEVLTATYTLALPVDPAQADLRYYFGYYDWRDGSRLPVNRGADDKVVLYGR